MEDRIDLLNYEKHDHVVSDRVFGRLGRSIIILDVRSRKETIIKAQSSKFVKTKIFIEGPIRRFTMYIKKHKISPLPVALLKTIGFISPFDKSILRIEIQNNTNTDLW